MYAMANKMTTASPNKSSKPLVRPAPDDEETEEPGVLPPASSSSPDDDDDDNNTSSSQLTHNQNISDFKSRRHDTAATTAVSVSSDDDLVYEDLMSSTSDHNHHHHHHANTGVKGGSINMMMYDDKMNHDSQEDHQDLKGPVVGDPKGERDGECDSEHSPTASNSHDDEDDDEDEDDEVHTEQDDDDDSMIVIQDHENEYVGGPTSNDEDDDVHTEQDDDDIINIQDEDYVVEHNDVVNPAQTVSPKKGETGGDDDREEMEEGGYENESEDEGSGHERDIDYKEEIELPPPQPQEVQEGEERVKKSISAPKGADVEAVVLISEEEEKEEEDAPHDKIDAPHDKEVDEPHDKEVDELKIATVAAAAAVAAPELSLQEEAPLDPGVINMDPNNSKTTIGLRLTQAVDAAPLTKTRSPELVPLTKDYDIFRKRLRTLIAATKNYHQQTKNMEQARLQVVKEFSILSEKTPLFDHVGQRLDAEQLKRVEQQLLVGDGESSLATTTSAQQDFDSSNNNNNNKSVTKNVIHEVGNASSMAALEQVTSLQATSQLSDYQRRVIDYAVEWNHVVTSRIDMEIKVVNKLRQATLHYEKKVETLRSKVNALEQKGKSTPDITATRLTRNEEKLSDAWKNHERSSGRLVVLMEEAVTCGWKDLYPLVKNAMTWEVNRVARENDTYGRLSMTLKAMESTFKQHIWTKPTQSAASLEEV